MPNATQTFILTSTVGAAAILTTTTGTPQTVYAGTKATTPLAVTLTDAYSNPITGATVTFTAPTTGASAQLSTPAVTNASGQTSVTAMANSTAGGPYTVTATYGTLSASFILTNQALPNLVVTTNADDAGTTTNCTAQTSTTKGTDTTCTLRDALLKTESLGAANIYFDATAFASAQTITLGTALPAIADSLNLNGPGANLLTISGHNSSTVSSIFTVNSGSVVNLSGLTITKGNSSNGGAIFNSGTLTVINSVLSNNAATVGGAINNHGTLTINDSTIYGNAVADYCQRETPRLCRGCSSSLTFPGVHPETLNVSRQAHEKEKPDGRICKLKPYEMGLQVSHCVYPEVPQKGALQNPPPAFGRGVPRFGATA